MKKIADPNAPLPQASLSTMQTRISIRLDQLPTVPTDTAEVQGKAAATTRRMPEASASDAQEGLQEIATRGEAFPGELGDLGPDPKLAAELARELALGAAIIVRLEGLLRDTQARMTVLKGHAVTVLDEAEEQIVQREQRGRIQPESYAHVHRFVAARGEAIAEGIVRAKALKAAQKTGAANDANAVKKTG